ncbi:putative glycosyltransferase 5 [Acorus gramineus]|uniref:Glycosyltransferase 5 n=1 Tax=Acorus gramineus TaxID=55184 RepID=A0AAV9B996_ACOGR|nr:putative glycosyltransferase 5 [Acorus gramineus]
MGQEGGMALRKDRAGAGHTLPTTIAAAASRSRRGRQKTFYNLKITLICGFITVIVLRGTVGVGNILGGGDGGGDEERKIIEQTNRLVAEIRSDSDPDEVIAFTTSTNDNSENGANSDSNSNSTAIDSYEFLEDGTLMRGSDTVVVPYSLGPKISDWDEQRRSWLETNPGFPTTVASGMGGGRRQRVLLVTGSPPGPCDNPMGDHYLLKAIKNKIDYCRLHGMEIVYNLAHLDPEMAGYWSKLPLLRRLMLSHPEVEWIWWMDSDALFTDMAFEVPLERYASHNLVIHGYPDLLFDQNSWIGLNTGSFLIRNCQWSLDLLDAWAPMGPKGPIRDAAGRLLTAKLKGRPAFEADDQSALIYLLVSRRDFWGPKIYIENSYYLHGFWEGLVDRYEEMLGQNHPGLGDERWPFVTHFVGCKPCGSYGDYPVERCLSSMERAFNFADNQVLRLYGFAHPALATPKIRRIRDETADPLNVIDHLDPRAPIVTRRASAVQH